MSEQGAEGLERKARSGIDRAEGAANATVDQAGDQVKGEARQFAGAADGAAGAAKDVIGKAAERARAAVGGVGGRAGEAYAALKARAQEVSGVVDPFVRESPYLAAGVAALAGVILGALLFGGGSRVVYLEPSGD